MTTETAQAVGTLSAQDVKALRQAEDIVIRRLVNGETTIECIKRAKNDLGWNTRESRYTIRCTSYVEDYSAAYLDGNGRKYSAVEVINASVFNETVHTALTLVKLGDIVSLRFSRACDNDYMREAFISYDRVDLIVCRGKQRLSFRLSDQVTKVDSLARMIRYV